MVFQRLRLFIVFIGVLTFSFCIVQGVRAQIQSSSTSDMVDPDVPGPRYVLDKLNRHISDYQSGEGVQIEQMKNTAVDVEVLKKEDLKTQVAVLTDKVDTQGWLLKALLGGMATLLGKDVMEIIKNRNPK